MELTQLERDLFKQHRRGCPCNRADSGRDKCGLPTRKPWVDVPGYCADAEDCPILYWLRALGLTDPALQAFIEKSRQQRTHTHEQEYGQPAAGSVPNASGSGWEGLRDEDVA